MRKILLMLLASILTVGLIACGEGSTDGDLTAADVYEKTFTKMEDMESATMVIDLEQDIQIPGEDTSISMGMSMNGDIIMDPMQMHQKMDIKMDGDDLGPFAQDVSMEFYLTEDAFYMLADETGGQWLKMDPEDAGIIDGMMEQQDDPAAQLEALKEYVDDLSIEEDGDSYVLKLTADADGFDKLIEEALGESMADELLDEDFDISEDLDIKTLEYEMIIDKESFLLTNFTLNMDLSITVDGETADIKQSIKASYDNINEVDEIKVPQDVIDNAVEQ